MQQRGEIGFFGEVCTWRGASGKRYVFSVHTLDAPTLALDGVYVLAAPGNLFTPYRPLLIGSCENFARDLPLSALAESAVAAGASSLHLYYSNLTNPDRAEMLRDLVDRYRPRLNQGHAPRPADEAARPAPPMGVVIPFPVRRQG